MTYDPGPPPELQRKNITPSILVVFGVLIIVWIVAVDLRFLALVAGIVTVIVAKHIRDREDREYRNAYDDWARAAWAAWHAEHPQGDDASEPVVRGYGTARNISVGQNWYGPQPRQRSGWSTAGTVVAAIAAIGGLAMMAMIVFFVVALGSGHVKMFGNK